MLYTLSLELRHLGFDCFVGPANSSYVGMCEIVISINSNRKHHRHVKSNSLFLLWLQDCPYSYFRTLSRSRSCLKHRDILLFAAPQYFGFDWTRLINRGIRISSLFYGYDPYTDIGAAAISAKHPASRCADSPPVAPFAYKVSKPLSLADKHSKPLLFSEHQEFLDSCLSSPIITLGGYYEKSLASFVFGESFSIRYPFRWALTWYYSNIAKLYPPFKGALARLRFLNPSRNPLRAFFFNIFLLDINTFSRIIERTLLIDGLLTLFLAPHMRRHLLLVGGASRSLTTSDIFRLPDLPYSEYNNLLGRTHAIICNNTHGLGLHPRVLDSMACGTVVLHHLSPSASGLGVLEHHFQQGIHFLGWTNINDLLQLLEDIVSHKYDMSRIALAAYERVKECHSWSTIASQLVPFLAKD